MNETDILFDFLKMPLGSSDEVFKKFAAIPGARRRGDGAEQFLYIRGSRDNKVLLVAHADTYWDENSEGYNTTALEQDLLIEDGIIRNRNGGLGADDRAGCAMIWLMKDFGHSILITNGEELGRKGSKWLMSNNPDIAEEINNNHLFIIQLDRKNGKDFKCYSVGTDKFRCYVRKITGYSEPDKKASTDIKSLCRRITGVNLSIGYRDEHEKTEHLVLQEWQNTLDVCRKWLQEDNLPRFDLN